MLMPKRMKHRKQHRGRMRGMATRGNRISFGEYGIMALEPSWITSRQIEAARIAMTRAIKRGGQVWIRIFPDKPITKKPLEQRMGKGKAAVEGYVAVVKPGRIMFEMSGVPVEAARAAMRLAISKLPIDCKFVTKDEVEQMLAIPVAAGQADDPSPEAPRQRSKEAVAEQEPQPAAESQVEDQSEETPAE